MVLYNAERCCVVVWCCVGHWLKEMQCLEAFVPIQTLNNFIDQQLELQCDAMELRKG